ncbi:MAG: hypothetical protein MUE81_08920 [Thermoflexibacter sp.]|nr:hypothetical protein [Thermoflexibacter sp.]
MEEFLKILFAIVVAILYYLFKSKPSSKADNTPSELNPPLSQIPRQEEVVEKVVTFDDILKKFESGNTQTNKNLPQELSKIRTAQLRKLIKEREIKLEDEEEEEKKNPKENASQLLTRIEQKRAEAKKISPKVKEIHKDEGPKMEIDKKNGRFDNYENEKNKSKTEELSQLTKNPQALRNAFILSEILNRKY